MSGAPPKVVRELMDELAELAAARAVLPASEGDLTYQVMRPWQRADGRWACSVALLRGRPDGWLRLTVDGADIPDLRRVLTGGLKVFQVKP